MTPDTIGTYTADSEEPGPIYGLNSMVLRQLPFLKEAGINTKTLFFN